VKSPLLVSDKLEITVDPAFRSVRDALAELPKSILPKAKADDPATSSDCVPIPVNPKFRGRVVAEEARDNMPLRMPVPVGLKVTEIVQPAFAASEMPDAGQLLTAA